MAKFVQVCSLLVISTAALASAGVIDWQPWHGHGHDSGSSYAVVTKHESAPKWHGWAAAGGNGHWQESNNHWAADHHAHEHEPHSYPKYEFDYGVKDTKTGDVKNQWETRDGDKVKGGYTMKEADGRTRVVEYTADDHSGFNAVVKHIGHADHPAPVHHHNGGWEGAQAHHGHHGHASSYVNVNQINHSHSKW